MHFGLLHSQENHEFYNKSWFLFKTYPKSNRMQRKARISEYELWPFVCVWQELTDAVAEKFAGGVSLWPA